MPYIYIKTPLYKNSKFVPHLVEHLINLKTELSPSHYFSFLKDAEMTVTATYTLIDLPKEQDAMIYLEKLLEPLCTDLIPSETKAICEENTRNDYTQKLFEKIGKQLYGKDFRINSCLPKASKKEILEYHQKYYTKDNIIVCDDEYRIIFSQYQFVDERQKGVLPRKRFQVKVRGYTNFVSTEPRTHWQQYYFFFFVQELLDAYFGYTYRFQKKRYYYDIEAFFFMTEDHNIFALADDFDVGFDEDFFLESKKHFKNILLYSYGRKGKILSQLLFGIELTDEQIITYLDSISLEDVRTFLGKKEDYMEKRSFLSTKNQ